MPPFHFLIFFLLQPPPPQMVRLSRVLVCAASLRFPLASPVCTAAREGCSVCSSSGARSSGPLRSLAHGALHVDGFCVRDLWLVLFVTAYSCFLVAAYSLISLRILIMHTLKSYSGCCFIENIFIGLKTEKSYKISKQTAG